MAPAILNIKKQILCVFKYLSLNIFYNELCLNTGHKHLRKKEHLFFLLPKIVMVG